MSRLSDALEVLHQYELGTVRYTVIRMPNVDTDFNCTPVDPADKEEVLVAAATVMLRCEYVSVRRWAEAYCYELSFCGGNSAYIQFLELNKKFYILSTVSPAIESILRDNDIKQNFTIDDKP